MSIASELTTLAANKAAIKAAIEAKNPSTMPTDALSQWPASIASISGGGGVPYTEVEYLQSDGAQYIDTQIFYNYGSDMAISAKVVNLTQNRSIVVGNYVDSSHSGIDIELGGVSTSHAQQPRALLKKAEGSSAASDVYLGELPLNEDINISLTYEASTGAATFSANNLSSSFTVPSTAAVTNPNSIKLFLDNRASPTSIANPLRIKSISITIGGIKVRDYVSVRVGSVGYLYDKTSGQLFGNVGTGAFTYGSDVAPTQSWIYGYVIDESDSNPATRVTYIEDNAGFDPLYMDFANDALVWGDWQDFVEGYFRPAMLKSDGTIDYYLDPNDLTKKADGVTASDVANTGYDGNAMLIVKPIYYNINRISDWKVCVRFSNIKQGDDWYNWTHLKSDGTYAEFCGWPLFTGSVVGSKLRSMATGAVPNGTLTQANEYAYAIANGSNWYTTTWADEMMIRLLFPLLCKSTDSQGKIGGGASRNSLSSKCGDLYDKGYFYGNSNVTSSTQYGSKFLCMENVWGERWRRCVGFASNQIYMVKLTPSTIDGSTTTDFFTFSGFRQISPVTASTGNVLVINSLSVDPLIATVPTIVNNDIHTSVNYGDHYWRATGTNYPILVGGGCDTGAGAGVFCTLFVVEVGAATWNVGASLSYHFY